MGSKVPDMVDIAFELKGNAVPGGYAFSLWHEIVRVLPWLESEKSVGVIPLRGTECEGERLLARRSKLVLRVPAGKAEQAMALAGQELQVGSATLAVGTGTQRVLQPYATLHSYLVETAAEEQDFLEEVGSQLRKLEVDCSLICGRHTTLNDGGQSVSGYSLVLHELKPDDSLRVQYAGLGGKRRFGCGIFVPYKTISGLD